MHASRPALRRVRTSLWCPFQCCLRGWLSLKSGAQRQARQRLGCAQQLPAPGSLPCLCLRTHALPRSLCFDPLATRASYHCVLPLWPQMRVVRLHTHDPGERARFRREVLSQPRAFDVAVTTYDMCRVGPACRAWTCTHGGSTGGGAAVTEQQWPRCACAGSSCAPGCGMPQRDAPPRAWALTPCRPTAPAEQGVGPCAQPPAALALPGPGRGERRLMAS